jgi:hypothetical protein
MPYIKLEDRKKFTQLLLDLGVLIKSEGELNYCISILLLMYMASRDKSYSLLNKIMGVLECAKLEFYRRFVVPYEDEKIRENGDITSLPS